MGSSGSEGPRSPGREVVPSPNIWYDPAVYELENTAVDRAGVIWQTIRSIRDWRGADVLDVGCGTGYHLPYFAADAASVVGVEPHPPLAAIARRRTRRLPSVRVLDGMAAALPLADRSIDVVHARWAYFFGPGCEPGLSELERVVRPGGAAFVIDNDPERSTFGRWFRRGYPGVDPDEVATFWLEQGWQRERIEIEWSFAERGDFEEVVKIEFPAAVAEEILAEDADRRGVDYAVNIWWRRY